MAFSKARKTTGHFQEGVLGIRVKVGSSVTITNVNPHIWYVRDHSPDPVIQFSSARMPRHVQGKKIADGVEMGGGKARWLNRINSFHAAKKRYDPARTVPHRKQRNASGTIWMSESSRTRDRKEQKHKQNEKDKSK
jgi:hypothetical protein